MWSPTCCCAMSLIINFVPVFIVSVSVRNAFFTGGKSHGIWWLGFLVFIPATQVEFLGRELRSHFTPPLMAAFPRSEPETQIWHQSSCFLSLRCAVKQTQSPFEAFWSTSLKNYLWTQWVGKLSKVTEFNFSHFNLLNPSRLWAIEIFSWTNIHYTTTVSLKLQ